MPEIFHLKRMWEFLCFQLQQRSAVATDRMGKLIIFFRKNKVTDLYLQYLQEPYVVVYLLHHLFCLFRCALRTLPLELLYIRRIAPQYRNAVLDGAK